MASRNVYLLQGGAIRPARQAVLLAAKRSPNNPQVKMTLQRGLPNALVFQANMPADVCVFLVRLHNAFHTGSSSSWLELLGDLRNVESRWATHRLEHGIVSRGGTGAESYERKYWAFISTQFPGLASS